MGESEQTPILVERAPDPRIGMVLLDRFRVIELIGSGGMGSVYKAENLEVGNDVAVKFLHLQDHDASGEDTRRRFIQEMDLMASLTDVRVLRVLAKGSTEYGEPFMVTEFLKGENLEEKLRREHKVPAKILVEWLKDVCLVLSEAHAKNIIHRDIKPANLFVQEGQSPGGQIRVLDFGIAKVTQEVNAMTTIASGGQAVVLGTYSYMSPEQARAIPVLPQSDLYSLGVVAYECLAGRPPFVGGPTALIAAHQMAEPQPLVEVAKDESIPPDLERLVQRMLHKDPNERPQSAEEVIELLGKVRLDGRRTPEVPEPPTRRLALVGGALFVTALVTVIVLSIVAPVPDKVTGRPAAGADGQDASTQDAPSAAEGAAPVPPPPSKVEGAVAEAAEGEKAKLEEKGPEKTPEASPPRGAAVVVPPPQRPRKVVCRRGATRVTDLVEDTAPGQPDLKWVQRHLDLCAQKLALGQPSDGEVEFTMGKIGVNKGVWDVEWKNSAGFESSHRDQFIECVQSFAGKREIQVSVSIDLKCDR